MDWKALIQHKSVNTLVAEALQGLRQKGSKITELNPGGVFRTLVELSSQGIADLYSLILLVLPQGFVVHATGKWLDLHCQGVGLTRRPAKKALGMITFGRNDPSGNIRIRAGSIAKTDVSPQGTELRYFVTQEVIIPSGEHTALVPVRAEFEGAMYNAGPSYINKLVTHISGVDYITNQDSWLVEEGADVEDDESLRRRYFDRWDELSAGATAVAYSSWARQIPGVVDVSVNDRFPRGQGTVDVIITSPAGPPSPELIESVQEFLETQKPITDNVLVKAPEAVQVGFEIIVWLHPSRGDLGVVKQQAEGVIQGLFIPSESGISTLRIGEDLYKARITAVLMAIEHVVNVTIGAPTEDVIVDPGQLCVLGEVAVTAQRAVEV